MEQLTIFDILEPRIKRIKSNSQVYEIGKNKVMEIKLTNHGDKKTTIYQLNDKQGNLILFVGLLPGHEIIWEGLE